MTVEEFAEKSEPFLDRLDSDKIITEEDIDACNKVLKERRAELEAKEDDITDLELYQYCAASWQLLYFRMMRLQEVTQFTLDCVEKAYQDGIGELISKYQAIVDSYKSETSCSDDRTAGLHDGIEVTLRKVIDDLKELRR